VVNYYPVPAKNATEARKRAKSWTSEWKEKTQIGKAKRASKNSRQMKNPDTRAMLKNGENWYHVYFTFKKETKRRKR
jgi:hypothetical protein